VTAGQALSKAGGRTFVLTLGCGVATAILQWFGKLDPAGSTYALVVSATVGAYITGNTVQRIKGPKEQQP